MREGAQGDDLCIVIWILTEKYSKGMCKAWVSEGAQGGIHSSLSVSQNPPQPCPPDLPPAPLTPNPQPTFSNALFLQSCVDPGTVSDRTHKSRDIPKAETRNNLATVKI